MSLNWKSRLIERTIGVAHRAYRRAIGRLDEFLGTTHIYQMNLNWKGRLVERTFGAIDRVDERLGTTHLRQEDLNWKGRAIERAIAAARLVAWWTLGLTNWVCFAIFYVGRKLMPRRKIRSVLHISILSHKPFMISRVQRQEGLQADYFALNVDIASQILNLGWDYSLPYKVSGWRRRLLEFYYLWTVVAHYDVVHSHFKSTLSHTGWELKFLKKLGTILVFHFRGCDLRYRSLNTRIYPELNICEECDYPPDACDTDYQHRRVQMTREYGDLFFVTTPDLEPFLDGAEHIPFIHPTGIDLGAIEPVPRDRSIFRVVTSSNHPGIDGSRFVRDAVARLRQEGHAIELVEVADLPYRTALAAYKSADVFVGKLRMGYYNNANIETMMLGVANMSYIREEFLQRVPDCPIINTTPATTYERLRFYLEHRDELREIGARGPEFVSRHHDPATIARRMIGRYNEALDARRAGKRSGRVIEPTPPPSTVPLVRGDLTVVRPKIH